MAETTGTMGGGGGPGKSESSSRTSLFYDPKVRAIVTQVVVVGLLVWFVWFLVHNTITNLETRGIASGFGFLAQPASFDLSFKLIDFASTDSYGRAYVVGLYNTFLVAVFGCFLSTLIGVTVGVLRLSKNWLVAKLAYWYVECLRNIPLLLQMIFWWIVFLQLPSPRESISLGGGLYLNNSGLLTPTPIFGPGMGIVVISVFLGIIASVLVHRWAKARQERTGQIFPVWWATLGLVVGLPFVVFAVLGFPLSWEMPEASRFGFRGGTQVVAEFFAVLFALTIYTGAFNAEIVRAGILAISHGQTEAAYALGLRPNRTMRLVILPQALRVIIPMMTSQYLNLTKNSSLAVAVGYADVFAVFGQAVLNQTGQAVECIAIIMLTYLTISLTISFFMNIYNRRVALVER